MNSNNHGFTTERIEYRMIIRPPEESPPPGLEPLGQLTAMGRGAGCQGGALAYSLSTKLPNIPIRVSSCSYFLLFLSSSLVSSSLCLSSCLWVYSFRQSTTTFGLFLALLVALGLGRFGPADGPGSDWTEADAPEVDEPAADGTDGPALDGPGALDRSESKAVDEG